MSKNHFQSVDDERSIEICQLKTQSVSFFHPDIFGSIDSVLARKLLILETEGKKDITTEFIYIC